MYGEIFLACECNDVGSIGDTCNDQNGQCECQINFAGKTCDRCKDGYFDYPSCNCKYLIL